MITNEPVMREEVLLEEEAPIEHDLIYGLEDRPPVRDAIFAAIQHVFACFVGIITPALIIGGFAERIKFSSVLLFTILWLAFVYAPITVTSLDNTWGVVIQLPKNYALKGSSILETLMIEFIK